MKNSKIIAFILTFILFVSAVPVSAATDYITSADGAYTYRLLGGNATLTRYLGEENPTLNTDGSYTIPSEIDGHRVTALGSYLFAFKDVPAENVIIPDTVTVIEAYAFTYSEEVYDPVAAKNNPEYEPEDVYKSKLRHITIPESVVTIGDHAFHGAPNLEEIVLPDSLRELGENAFCDSGVKKVTIGKGLKTIGKYAFKGCEKLTEVIIPENVTEIKKGAFFGCYSLKRLDVTQNTRLGSHCYGTDYNSKPEKDKLLVFNVNKAVKFIPVYDAYKSNIPCAVNLNVQKTLLGGNVTGAEFKLLLNNKKPKSVKSSNKKVASVSGSKVKILAAGSAVITAEDENGETRAIRIKSFNNPSVKKKATVKKGKTVKLSLKGKVYSIKNKYTSTKTAKITSKASDSTIKIRGLKKGSTTLKIKVNGVKTLKIKVKVK